MGRHLKFRDDGFKLEISSQQHSRAELLIVFKCNDTSSIMAADRLLMACVYG